MRAKRCPTEISGILSKLTDIRHDTPNNDLALIEPPDGLSELGVVPSVDLAVAHHERRGRVHVEDLLGQGPVGSALCRRREQHRHVEHLADGGVRQHAVPEQRRVEVPREVEQALLEVQDDEKLSGGGC